MPSAAPRWIFGPFALDLANACLWRGTEAVALPPKAFDVLHSLVTQPGPSGDQRRAVGRCLA